MAIGMYGYPNGWHVKAIASFKEADAIQVSKYRRHVEAGTVPPESSTPYTRTGVEKYRHSCVADEFKPGAKPVLPLYTTRKLPVVRNFPYGSYTTTAGYVAKFNEINHYK